MKNCAKKVNPIFAALSLLFIAAISCAVLPTFTRNGTVSSNAATSVTLEYLHMPSGYRYLDSPTAIATSGNSYTVNDGLTVNGVSLSDTPKRIFEFEGGMLALCGNSLQFVSNGSTSPITACNDFAVDGANVYAASNGVIAHYVYNGNAFTKTNDYAILSSRNVQLEAHAIAARNGLIYIASNNPYFAAKDDIYVLNTATSELSHFYSQTDKLSTLTIAPAENALYALSDQHLMRYSQKTNSLETTVESVGAINIAVGSDGIYCITALNGINRYSFDLSTVTTICASASAENGFFNTPSGITVSGTNIYIADTINNRIAIYGNNIEYNNLSERPVSVAYDNRATLYTATTKSVRMTATSGSVITDNVREFVEYSTDDEIIDMKIDINQNVFALGKKALYRLSGDSLEVYRNFENDAFSAFCFRPGKADIYALTSSQVLLLGEKTDTVIANVANHGLSLVVDTIGAAYVLYRTEVTRYFESTETNYVFSSPLKSSDCYMALSTISNNYVDYGDLVISDAMAHTVYTVQAGARVIDGSYDVPDIDNGEATTGDDGIIRLANYDLSVYELPASGAPIYSIRQGSKVITAQYDLPDNDEFSLILVDDLTNKKLLTGYVYKNGLSAPLPYTAPPDVVGTITANDTKIYKWPSVYSSAVATADRYDTFEMRTFVGEFQDSYGNTWYRVNYNGRNGYEPGLNLSLLNFEPVFVRPDYNAEIISVNESTFAPTYSLTGTDYTQLSVTLPTGTRVEVVGMFDSSRPYTQIKYLDNSLGTLTCYVPTEYIHTDDTNIVIIVAVLLIVVTLSLAITLLCITLYRKNKRNNKDV